METGANMPGWRHLTEYKITQLRDTSAVLSGEQLSEQEIEIRDAEWEALGGGKDWVAAAVAVIGAGISDTQV